MRATPPAPALHGPAPERRGQACFAAIQDVSHISAGADSTKPFGGPPGKRCSVATIRTVGHPSMRWAMRPLRAPRCHDRRTEPLLKWRIDRWLQSSLLPSTLPPSNHHLRNRRGACHLRWRTDRLNPAQRLLYPVVSSCPLSTRFAWLSAAMPQCRPRVVASSARLLWSARMHGVQR